MSYVLVVGLWQPYARKKGYCTHFRETVVVKKEDCSETQTWTTFAMKSFYFRKLSQIAAILHNKS